MSFAHTQLRSYVDRVCRLNDDIKKLNGDKSEVYKEARADGFNPKVLKAAVKRFTQLQDDRLGVQEFDALFDMYMEALLGVSDDQGDAKSPPALNSGPASGIVESPTRAHARNDLPPHDEVTGEIIEGGAHEVTHNPLSDTKIRTDLPMQGLAPNAGVETSVAAGKTASNFTASPDGEGAALQDESSSSTVPAAVELASSPVPAPAASFDDPGPLPDFLRRTAA